MYNLNRKKEYLGILILFIFGILIVPKDIYAAADNSVCSSKINSKIKFSGWNDDNIGSDQTITVKVPKAYYNKLTVEYNLVEFGEEASDFDTDKNFKKAEINNKNYKATISLPAGYEVYIIVKLNKNVTITQNNVPYTCTAPGVIKIKDDDTFDATGTFKTVLYQNPAKATYISSEDTYDKTACQYMREGKYNDDGTTSSNDISQESLSGYQAFANKYFPYCFNKGEALAFTLSNKVINYARKQLIEIYGYKSNIPSSKITESEGFEISNLPSDHYLVYDANGNTKGNLASTNVGSLSCNKFSSDTNVQRYVYESKSEEKVNKKVVCSIKCREELEVNYSPPVATKAGLCFTYEVTVKTKVQCEVDMADNIELEKLDFCSPSPTCSGGTDQAGPSEEFDSCISQCDGGKYSQSCINSCYKKVYEGNDSKKTITTSNKASTSDSYLYTESDNASLDSLSFLSYSSSPLELLSNTTGVTASDYNIKGCTYDDLKAASDSKITSCAKKYMELKQENPLGYYYWTNAKQIKWKPNYNSYDINSNWKEDTNNIAENIKRAAPYYLRTVETTKSFIKSIIGEYKNGYWKKYVADFNGIKRQYSWRWKCSETCYFLGCSSSSVINNTGAYNAYKEMLENYKKAVQKCQAKATCETKTSTFTIDINAETNSDTAWKATNSTGNTDSDARNGDTLMFTPQNGDSTNDPYDGINGICYANRKMDWQHYKTTITFPGTWINLKTGKRVYHKEEYNEATMREKTNQFCVGYDYDPINESWWNWKINEKGDLSKTVGVTVEKDNNITASIKDFGKFGWNIKINCFYALSNKIVQECPPDDPNYPCDENKCDSENSTELCNAEFRPVNQQNLFPSEDGTGSRAAGFNWTSGATAEKAAGTSYGIDPGVYATKLQEEAATDENISYTGTADYSLRLTKDNIADLRNYVKKYGYTSYQGSNKNESPEGVEGLYYYTSNIIEKYTTNFKRTTKLGYNND